MRNGKARLEMVMEALGVGEKTKAVDYGEGRRAVLVYLDGVSKTQEVRVMAEHDRIMIVHQQGPTSYLTERDENADR